MRLNFRPACRRQNQNGDFPSGQILLVLKILVRRDKQIEFTLGFAQQITVAQIRPAFFKRRNDRMIRQSTAQRRGRSLIEKDFHGINS